MVNPTLRQDEAEKFVRVQESVEFNRRRLLGTLPHHPELPLPTNSTPSAASLHRVALNHTNANNRHVGFADVDPEEEVLLPPQAQLNSLEDANPNAPSAPEMDEIIELKSPISHPVPSPTELNIHWTPRNFFNPTNMHSPQVQRNPLQLTTMYAYTNSKYAQAKEALGGVEGLDFPSCPDELMMTPIPGMEGDLLPTNKVEEKLSFIVPADDPWSHEYDTDEGDYDLPPLVLKPINLDSIPAPSPSFLMQKLPLETHPFLAPKCKKDCRMWLWKNDVGKKARAALEKAEKEAEAQSGEVTMPSKQSVVSGNANTNQDQQHQQHFN